MDTNRNFPIIEQDENPDFKRYISLFLSNWYWFAITLFLSVTLAYGYNRYSEKLYTVTSSLLIKDDQFGGGGTGIETFLPGGDLFRSKQNLKNEIGILRSFALNRRVIDSLPEFHVTYVSIGKRNIAETRLYTNVPFIVIPADSFPQSGSPVQIRLLEDRMFRLEINSGARVDTILNFGSRFAMLGFDFTIQLKSQEVYNFDPSASNKYIFMFPSLNGLANQYRGKLGVNPIDEDATVLALSSTGPVLQQEADYLNKLMELYIEQGLEQKRITADSTISFIDRQLAVTDDSLKLAEEELMRFRDKHRLVDISREGGIIQSRLELFETERTLKGLQLQYYNYLNEYLASRSSNIDIISPSAMGVVDPQLVRLVQEFSTLQKQKRLMLMNLQPDSEPLLILERSLGQARTALGEIVEGGIETLNAELTDVGKRISAVESNLGALPEIEREYIRIQRKFEINNTVYTYLLEKRAEAGIARASTVSENRIIDHASVFNSVQIRPQNRSNLVMALLFGLFIPAVAIFLIDFFNNKIMDKRDVEKGTKAPIVGYISHNKTQTEIPVYDKPASTLAESFRSVRTNLNYFTTDVKTPVIAVSSTISAEGKTFVSINLAVITASLGKRVLLIGLDLRKPRIHKVLGIDNSVGMSTYLAGACSISDILQATKIDNLFYAPAGPVPPNPAELIDSERMRKLLEHAKKEYDYVIIDTPPIAVVTDALLIARHVDLYLLVVRQRYTSRNTLELIDDLYRKGTFKSIGLVLNDITLTGYYGYGLRYGYTLGYGYSYGYNYYNSYGYGGYGYSKSTKGYYNED